MVRRVVMGLALLGIVAAPVFATPAEPWDTGSNTDELNLFEIFNEVYATGFTSNTELDPYLVSPDELFQLIGSSGSATAMAHYAWYGQTFGYYTVDGGNNPVPTTLFTVSSAQQGLLSGIEAQINVSGDFGFFDTAGPLTWYSEPSRNYDQADHLMVYDTSSFTGRNTYLLAWEDLPLEISDRDYNDLVVEVYLGSRNIVPEPATMLLLGLGVAGLIVRKKLS